MSNYRQSQYDTPFSAAVAGGSIGNTMSDAFSNLRPQLLDDDEAQTPIPGFAELDAKWLTFNPGGSLLTQAVDTRLRMAKLVVASGKRAAGIFQQVPLPSVLGQTLEYAFYARVCCAEAVPDGDASDAIGNCAYGLAVATDMLGDAEATPIFIAGGLYARTALDDTPARLDDSASFVSLVSYDAFLSQQSEVEFGTPQWVRLRLKQTLSDVDEYTVDIAADVSSSGFDWQCFGIVPQSSGSDPVRSVGLVIQASDAQLSMYVQQFIAAEQAFADLSTAPAVGNQQQFGAV